MVGSSGGRAEGEGSAGGPEPAGEPEEAVVAPEEVDDAELGPVPGQVLVRIDRGGDGGVASTGFLDTLPVYSSNAAGVQSRTGNPELDAALDAIGGTALWRVAAPDAGGGIAGAEEPFAELLDLVLVDFDAKHSVEDAIATLGGTSLVTEVSASGSFSIALVPDDPDFSGQWGLTAVRCPEAWNTTQGDPSVVVAVLDTGCDPQQPDLSAQYAGEELNVFDSGQPAQDDHGHGTHVAGIISALGDNGVGVAGVSWRSKILSVKVLNAAGSVGRSTSGSSVAQGIRWASSRCSIMNLSIQGSVDDLSVRLAVDGARRSGVLLVAAMGNKGWGQATPSYPAAYAGTHDNVLAVGAVDRQGRRSVWGPGASSNTGTWIGLAAPGTNIDSTVPGVGVRTMSGTSQACPHVAGAAALVLAVAPGLTPPQVVGVLQDTARPLRDSPADPVPNPAYGFGLLDVAAAVDRAAGGGVAGVDGRATSATA